MSLLTEVMACPSQLDTLSALQWDSVLRLARFARLGARLHGMVEERGILGEIPDNARDVLEGARVYTDHMQFHARREILQLSTCLADTDFPVILFQ